MMNAAPSWSISAEWIYPVDAPPIHNGVLHMAGGRIEAIGPRTRVPPAAEHRELGRSAVLPGLVNAHCHLELTGLRGRLPRGKSLGRWLLALMRHRQGLDYSSDAAAGALELLRSGCTTVGDICHDNSVWPALKPLPLRKVCFAEVLGVGPLAGGAMDRLERSLCGVTPDERLRFGVSPHAPYSTSERVYRQAARYAREQGLPLTTHLAETRAERIFMRHGKGTLATFLSKLGLPSEPAAESYSVVEFAHRVGLLDSPVLLAHAHYLSKREMQRLAQFAQQVSVAYCPRSTAFFGRGAHPYPLLLEQGINVCLGTDSLASNDSLDMLAEMRCVRAEGRVDNETILRMATLNGARGLGMEEQIGTLAPGKQADWIALPVSAADPLEEILTGQARSSEVVVGGEIASI